MRYTDIDREREWEKCVCFREKETRRGRETENVQAFLLVLFLCFIFQFGLR